MMMRVKGTCASVWWKWVLISLILVFVVYPSSVQPRFLNNDYPQLRVWWRWRWVEALADMEAESPLRRLRPTSAKTPATSACCPLRRCALSERERSSASLRNHSGMTSYKINFMRHSRAAEFEGVRRIFCRIVSTRFRIWQSWIVDRLSVARSASEIKNFKS